MASPTYWIIASGESSMSSKSRAAASARSRCASFSFVRRPTKWVSIDFDKLANSSQWILLACFKPSSTSIATWVRKPSYRGIHGGANHRRELRID